MREANSPPFHDDVIKWKHFPRYWPFVRGIHRSPVNFPHNGQWREALMFSLICVWLNGWVNNREAGDLRRHRAHYDVIVMSRVFDTTANSRVSKHINAIQRIEQRYQQHESVWQEWRLWILIGPRLWRLYVKSMGRVQMQKALLYASNILITLTA